MWMTGSISWCFHHLSFHIFLHNCPILFGFCADCWYFLLLLYPAFYWFSCNLYIDFEEENANGHCCCPHNHNHNPTTHSPQWIVGWHYFTGQNNNKPILKWNTDHVKWYNKISVAAAAAGQWPDKCIHAAAAEKKIIWQVFQRDCKDSKYKVNTAIQHSKKVMGQIFVGGGGGCGRVGSTYSSHRRRRKNNLFAKDFKKKAKIAKKKQKKR